LSCAVARKDTAPQRGRWRFLLNLKAEAAMSDGREEREEREKRRELEKKEDREDRIDRIPIDPLDPWEPERNDS
jgi:hypothetical protein